MNVSQFFREYSRNCALFVRSKTLRKKLRKILFPVPAGPSIAIVNLLCIRIKKKNKQRILENVIEHAYSHLTNRLSNDQMLRKSNLSLKSLNCQQKRFNSHAYAYNLPGFKAEKFQHLDSMCIFHFLRI